MSDVRRLHPDDWQLLARIRLAALAESPGAFLSTLEREQGYDEAAWRDRLRTATWFAAVSAAGEPEGLCGLVRARDHPEGDVHLIGMWVAPARRGSGLAGELVRAAREQAAADGARRLTLWVMRDNARAVRAYQRLGLSEAEPPEGAHDYRCEGELFLEQPLS